MPETNAKLLVVASHPIPYWVPLYRRLAEEPLLDVLVAYGDTHGVAPGRKRWGQEDFRWSGDLLGRYPHTFLRNLSLRPAPDTRLGKVNPGLPVLFAGWRPDAILMNGHNQLFHALGILSAIAFGVPLLYVSDTNSVRDGRVGWRARLRKSALRLLYARVHRCLYVGRRNREHYENHGVPPEKLQRFALAVDNSFFVRMTNELRWRRDSLRAQWGIPAKRLVFVYVGRVEPWKGVDLLVRAIHNLSECHVLIVGTGSESGEIRRLAQLLAPGRVHFAGFLNTDRVVEGYAASDLLVLPSREESWGLVCNEALASGIPIVASDRVGAAADLAIEGHTGWTFRSGDVRDLERALRTAASALSREPDAYHEAARRLIEEYSIEVQVHGVLRALNATP